MSRWAKPQSRVAILFHITQSLPPVGAGTDCTPLITYQDKELKCQFGSFFFHPVPFFDIWHFSNSVCVPGFSRRAQWPNREAVKWPKINSKHALYVLSTTSTPPHPSSNNHSRGKRASLIENVLFLKWWETKRPLSVSRKLLVRLICMAAGVSPIVIMGANEFLCRASAPPPAAILWRDTATSK